MHDLWIHIEQLSQHTAPSILQVTGRSQSPHGKVSAAVVVGPGFSSISPAVAKRRNKRRRYLGGVFRSVAAKSRLRRRGFTVLTVLPSMVKMGTFSVGLAGDRALPVDEVTRRGLS